jgi:hypothetical protein
MYKAACGKNHVLNCVDRSGKSACDIELELVLASRVKSAVNFDIEGRVDNPDGKWGAKHLSGRLFRLLISRVPFPQSLN